jgi:AraC family transcriptional regulator of adaptative response / DNA-3-methyladenine glycosylase II
MSAATEHFYDAVQSRDRSYDGVFITAHEVELASTEPFDGLLEFFAMRAVPGVEEVTAGAYRRSVRLPHGAGVIELRPAAGRVTARLWLADERDAGAAIESASAIFDLDCDPATVGATLAGDPVLGALVDAAPGRRVPGVADGGELAIRAVLGQQVSVAGARTLAGRLVAAYGEPLGRRVGGVTHLFPSPARLADADPADLAMPRARRRAVLGLAGALAKEGSGALEREGLLALPGIGPWTASYVAMRALGDRDAFLETDLGVRHALDALGADSSPRAALALAERWRPHRAYAVIHLWSSLKGPTR